MALKMQLSDGICPVPAGDLNCSEYEKDSFARHGESVGTRRTKFTGWTDVDLTERAAEAKRAGRMMSEAGLSFEWRYSSIWKRAVKTLNYALDMMNPRPDSRGEELAAEREALRYPAGLNKKETARKVRQRTGVPVAPQLRCRTRPASRQRSPAIPGSMSVTARLSRDAAAYRNRWRMPWSVSYPLIGRTAFCASLDRYDQVLVAAHGNSPR